MNFKDRFRQKNTPFWIFTLALVTGLILPVLIMDGMFMDGVLYASVAHNLANGYGSMWFLKFSELGFAEHLTFHEHPPLVFWIQSLFFKVFGDSMYVERFYSLLSAFIHAWLIYRSWKLIHRDSKPMAQMSWLAVFMWILIPVSFWSFQNNVMENTMGIFVLLSFYFAIKALHFNEKVFFNMTMAGVFIFLASFSKGVPGLFPLAIPFLHWIIFRKTGFFKMAIYSAILLVVPAIIYGLIILIPDANESLSIYFYDRLLGRTTSKPTVDNRFWILIRLFMEILPLIVIVVVTYAVLAARKIKLGINRSNLQLFAFLFLVGLAGSVPIMLTMVQKPFYFSPSLPFFGMAFAMLIAPGLMGAFDKINITSKGYKIFMGFSLVCFLGVFVATYFQIGKISRDKDIVEDMYVIAEVIDDNTTIGVSDNMWNVWAMHCYMIRYWNISWDNMGEQNHEYYLTDRTSVIPEDSLYQNLNLATKKYDLYQRIEN